MSENIEKEVGSDHWLAASFMISLLFLIICFVLIPAALGFILPDLSVLAKMPEEVKVFISVIPHQLIMLGSVLMIAFVIKGGPSVAERLKLVNWKFFYIPLVIGIELPLLPALAAVIIIFNFLLSSYGISGEAPLLQTIIKQSSMTSFIIIAFGAVVIAPIVEEIIFRRIIFSFLNRYMSVGSAIFITAVFFAGVHQTLTHLPALFLLGVVLQILFIYCRSLYPCILLHSLHNFISMAVLFIIKTCDLPIMR